MTSRPADFTRTSDALLTAAADTAPMMEIREVAVCVFEDPEAAREAMRELQDAGFAGEDVSVLSPQDRHEKHDKGAKAREGAAVGAVAGGLFGGLAGWLVGLGSLAVPGVGPFIAAGALAAAIGGAALGAGLGAIAGALIRMGVPEDEAKYYEQEVRNGRTLLAVQGGTRSEEADRIMHNNGGYDARHPQNAPAGARRR